MLVLQATNTGARGTNMKQVPPSLLTGNNASEEIISPLVIMYVAFPSCMAGTASIGANKLLNLFIALEYYVHLLQKVQNLLRKYVINISGI